MMLSGLATEPWLTEMVKLGSPGDHADDHGQDQRGRAVDPPPSALVDGQPFPGRGAGVR
jgi:hypothetical protein